MSLSTWVWSDLWRVSPLSTGGSSLSEGTSLWWWQTKRARLLNQDNPVFVFNCCCNKLSFHRVRSLSSTYNFVSQKLNTGVAEWKSRCWEGCISFWRRICFLASSNFCRCLHILAHGLLLASKPATWYPFDLSSFVMSPFDSDLGWERLSALKDSYN